jgi:hypothetical protein
LPGGSQYTQSFTTATQQDVTRIIARHLRPIFCDPDKDFKEERKNLDPTLLELLQCAEGRLVRGGKSGNKRLSSKVNMLAEDCLHVCDLHYVLSCFEPLGVSITCSVANMWRMPWSNLCW